MILSFLFGVCSAVIIFKGKPYHEQYITELLSGKQAIKVDLSNLTFADFKFIPEGFIGVATPEQWLHLKTFGAGQYLSEESKQAYLNRIRREQIPLARRSWKPKDTTAKKRDDCHPAGSEEIQTMLDDLNSDPFQPIPIPPEDLVSYTAGGHVLFRERDIPLDDVFTWNESLKQFTIPLGKNTLRSRAWNYLTGHLKTSKVIDGNRRILLDWAFISLVFSNGLKTNTNSQRLISWIKRIHIFNQNSKIPTETWISLLKQCKRANFVMWNKMRSAAVARVQEDPFYADYNPYDDLPDEVEVYTKEKENIPPSLQSEEFFADAWKLMETCPWWIPALDEEMNGILELPAPSLEALKEIWNGTRIGGHRIPFLLQEVPTISELFQGKPVIFNGRLQKGYFIVKHIQKQYRTLKGPIKASEADKLLIAEWAMISIIFNHGCMPRPHCSFTLWLFTLRVDFAKLVSVENPMSLEESVRIMRKGRELSPKLWDSLAKVAAGRFLADPNLEDLPLLKAWCEAKGFYKTATKTLGDHEKYFEDGSAVLPAIILPRSVSSIMDDLEKALEDLLFEAEEVSKLFTEIYTSLKEDQEQLPHALVFAKEIEKFLK